MKNRIVIVGNISPNNLNYYVWKEAIDSEKVMYLPIVERKKLFYYAQKIVFNKITKKILPFLSPVHEKIRYLVVRSEYIKKIPSDTDIIILSHISTVILGKSTLQNLKKKGIRIALMLIDSISALPYAYSHAVLECCSMGIVDIAYSFDKADCHRYGFKYWEQICTPPVAKSVREPKYELSFAGRDKGRFEVVHTIISKLITQSLKNIDSAIVRMPELTSDKNKKLEAVIGENFHSEMIGYDKSVNEILDANCILDLVQNNQDGISWRAIEAFYYNKKLLTNNKSILKNKYYTPNYIQYFEDVEEIDFDWVREREDVNFEYKNDYSPVKLVEDILISIDSKKRIKKNELSIIIQARVGSTRLPNKILLPFYKNDSILTLMVDKLGKLGVDIVVATSDDSRNDIIEQEMKKVGVKCFRGSEDNVLNRFIEAAKQADAKYLIRVCSDNPFLDYNAMKQLVDTALEVGERYDYIGFRVNDTPSIKTHFGLWAEFVSLAALEKVANLTQDKLYIEHVTNYVYSHPDIFEIKWLPVSSALEGRQNIRLTIDTEADFKNAQKVYSAMQQSFVNYTVENLVTYLDDNPELYHLMENQILNNSK